MSKNPLTLSPAKRRVLELLTEQHLTTLSPIVLGFRRKTIDALCDMGLVKFRPYAQDPHYALTQEGKAALKL